MITSKNIRNKVFDIRSLAIFIWVIIVFLYSGSPFQTIFDIRAYILPFGVLAFILSIPSLLNFGKTQCVLLVVSFMAIFTMLAHLEFQKEFYLRFLSIVFISYYLAWTYSFAQITKCFKNIMKVLFINITNM